MSGMSGMSSSSAAAAAPSSSAAADPASMQGDVEFAQGMIPHHEQAIEMADLALKNASSAQVKDLATQIKAAQDPEIQTMRGWLKTWGAEEDMAGMDHSGMDMGGMPGTMSDDDMKKLGAAKGAEFDRMWLQLMIAHHQGALTMANQELATTADPKVKTLAEAIVSGQTKEIDTMKGLLAG
ncbi:MAG: DUF305 domain-containing protein [Actinobacteria bacterium]|nr:DUF305 domain-containing protein [Actinomycetota bacterium]